MKKRILAFTLCLVVAFMFGACGNSKTVATVNGEEITIDELKYFVIQAATQLETEHADPETGELPENFWDTELEGKDGKTAAEYVLDTAMDAVVEFHIYKIESDKLGIKLSDEDTKAIESQKQSMIDSYGEVIYREQLKAAGFTEEIFMELMTLSAYSQKLYENFSEGLDEEEINKETKAHFEENYLKAKHILISTQDMATGASVDEATMDQKKALVEEIHEKIKAGADFDELVKEYGEDPGMESEPGGYVFTEGEMVTEFYEGTKALKVGEVSKTVHTEYGMHIIKREALTDEDFETHSENVKSSITSKKFVEKLEEYKDAAKVKKTSAYKKIDVKAIWEQYKIDYEAAAKVIEEEYAKMQEEAAAETETPVDEAAVPEGEAVSEEKATEEAEEPAAE